MTRFYTSLLSPTKYYNHAFFFLAQRAMGGRSASIEHNHKSPKYQQLFLNMVGHETKQVSVQSEPCMHSDAFTARYTRLVWNHVEQGLVS